jgi:glycine/D-amino acid oxidase-like deaminating enzyme
MRIIEEPDALSQLAADVCVVGGGPIGICVALDMCRRGLSVVLLESGLRQPSLPHQALSDAILTSERRHAPMSLAVCRAVGGTSWLWGGRCVPLDPLDFEARPHVPESGWPISDEDVSPYYAEAARLLGCGPAEFARDGAALKQDDVIRIDQLERWANEPNLALRLQPSEAPGLTIVLNATVVDLEFAPGAERVTAAIVASRISRMSFKGAKAFVLACGGQLSSKIPNVSFYPDNPRIADPGHRSGILSMAFLLLSMPAVGRRLASEPIRRLQVGAERRYDALNAKDNFRFDRTIIGWRGRCVVDLRRKR